MNVEKLAIEIVVIGLGLAAATGLVWFVLYVLVARMSLGFGERPHERGGVVLVPVVRTSPVRRRCSGGLVVSGRWLAGRRVERYRCGRTRCRRHPLGAQRGAGDARQDDTQTIRLSVGM